MNHLHSKTLPALLGLLFLWTNSIAQVDTLFLDPSGNGTQGDSVTFDSSRFDIDMSGNITYALIGDEDWENVSGTTDESPFFGQSFGLYWGGMNQADTSTGAIIQAGGIHRPGNGNLGVTGGGSNGIEPGEGLYFGLDLRGLPSNVSVKFVGITTGFLSTNDEPAKVIDASDSSNALLITRLDPDQVDISALDIHLNGGEVEEQLFSVVHVGTGGAWRITGITLAFSSSPTPINNPPTISNPLSDLTLKLDSALRLDVSTVFTDADGDSLTLAALSGDPSIYTANLNGDSLTLSPMGLGMASLTLSASDGSDTTELVVNVTVIPSPSLNQSPVVANAPGDLTLQVDSLLALDASDVFTDPDGDSLILIVTSSDPSIATAKLSNDSLIVSGIAIGSTSLILSASDGRDTTDLSIAVTVETTTDLAEYPFSFSVYPNPVRDVARIDLFGSISSKTSFSIINHEGQVMQSKSMDLGASKQQHELDLRRLPSGIYFLQIKGAGYTAIKQIIKE